MVPDLTHSIVMEISPGNKQPESSMRRADTNASPPTNHWPEGLPLACGVGGAGLNEHGRVGTGAEPPEKLRG